MVNIDCDPNGHCPYEYFCDTTKNSCIHDPVFPLTLYPILIYCLFPFASAICNTTGNSFGQFKVLFLMDLLDYTESAATVLTYPLTVGTALFNFITLIFRRHPQKNTSAVDFNIVLIIIPSVLFGSTVGALVNKFIPPIIADGLIIFILGAFSVKFFLRYYNYRMEQLRERQKELTQLREIQITEVQKKIAKETERMELTRKLLAQSQDKKQKNQEESINAGKQDKDSVSIGLKIVVNPYQDQLQQQLQYQQSYHLPHILATCIIFAVFQSLSFLAQGKIIPFSICGNHYKIGMSCLTLFFIGIVVAMYFYTKRKMQFYKKIQYPYQYKLDSIKFYVLVILASFMGGFNGGVFGVGSSTTMIFSLLYLEIQPIVVSATVGYQVIFGGLGSLCEAFATNEIALSVAGFFLLITFVVGGALSYITLMFVKKLNQNKTNQVLMMIVGLLTGFSTLALVANIILSYDHFGAAYMISSPFEC